MAFKLVVLMSVLAAASAGLIADHGAAYIAAPAPAITSGHQNILRTPGNLGQVSTYSKTIDTPFSSVSKHDVRVSNPGVAVHAAYAAPVAYAPAPAHYDAYAAPAHYAAPVAKIAAPVAYAAPAHYAAPTAYAAPAHYAAPVAKIAAPVAYAAPAHYAAPAAYAAPAHYAAPSHYAAPITKVAAAPALLGVAYSAAPAVSHMTYTNNLGLSYAW